MGNAPDPSYGFTRRVLLRGLATTMTITSFSLVSSPSKGAPAVKSAADAATGSAISEQDFLHLSQLLTRRDSLDSEISNRALSALTATDPTFPAAAETLRRTLHRENLTDVNNLSAFAEHHPELMKTATSIIAAWYLGYSGTPAIESTKDDAHFICYQAALMYQPTIDATVIPTYARGHTNYWATPPATLSTD